MKNWLMCCFLVVVTPLLCAHSPWSQYQVYRQKHLLIMSSIPDEPTYPFSLRLVAVINEALPEAKARPARAKHFERVHSLFLTKQMQLMLLSRHNAEAALEGSGPFAELGPLQFRIIYQFADLQLLAQIDLPDQHAWLLTNAIMHAEDISEQADDPDELAPHPNLHPGSRAALNDHPFPE